ncbi:MAG: methyltransferase domain-containing protein [Cyanobacteriota bacterium]|nr:methyltransferase domain-containing protein [Cyanobacteriota bacterium]
MPTPELVRSYYGQELHSSADLKTNACCDADAVPGWLQPFLAKVHPEVRARYYGCGLVVPPLLEGCTVMDLGCGAGRDVYLLAQLVGASGRVVGVDMTPEQLAVARAHQTDHARQFGFDNVTFIEGQIEALAALGLPEASVDVVVSNCVLNLCPDKATVLRGVQRLLKPGGEFFFSDVYCDRRLPDAVRQHPVLWGECLAGALYGQDFLRLARSAGFHDPRLVNDRPLAISEPDLGALVEGACFYTATWRLFSLNALEESAEDYGDEVCYKGTIQAHPQTFALDQHHCFPAGESVRVCRNTFLMLSETRFAPHFEMIYRGDHHRGVFPGSGSHIPFHNDMSLRPQCEAGDHSAAVSQGCC